MKVCLIAAVGTKGQLGKDNKLLWSIPEDLKLFKQLTLGHPIIMGRKTFESIGKVLPGRQNIIISRQLNYQVTGGVVCSSLISALEFVQNQSQNQNQNQQDRAFIIGGASIYQEALGLAQCIYLTKVDYDGPADVFFPDLDSTWKVVEQKDLPTKSPYKCQFQVLKPT